MKFMLLLFDAEHYWERVSPDQMGEALAGHQAFAEFLTRRGVAFSGEAVKPSNEARTLRPYGATMTVADGPALVGGVSFVVVAAVLTVRAHAVRAALLRRKRELTGE
ncbi:YciI family protein [Nonomuraea sp. LPB2021202275-12-8]|uniref:YciI family protein n=1 Tax=Nonomuraea sp. LPB2021202275-12-8 TaxID=3120159 RepID=UPI00300C04AD